MKITDSMTLDASGLSFTNDGYLIGDAKIARAGNVQIYSGAELGMMGEDALKSFGVYRDPDMVFDKDAMLSLAGRPVTRGHPDGGVTADNWQELAVGQVGGVIRRDGEHVVAPMAIMDANAAREVSAGARSLSAGYTVNIVQDEGVSPDGEAYQFRQTGPLRFNHVAYLPDNNPRAGNTRIGDKSGFAPNTESMKGDTMSDALKSVVLGDTAVQVPAAEVAAIEKFKADSAKKLSDAEAKHAEEITKKDEEIGTLKADLKKAQDAAKIDVDKLVADRSALVSVIKAIDSNIDVAGKTDADLKKAAVASKLGDEMVKDASEGEISGMFKAIAKDAEADPVVGAIKTGNPHQTDAKPQQTYVDRMTRRATA